MLRLVQRDNVTLVILISEDDVLQEHLLTPKNHLHEPKKRCNRYVI